MSVPPWAGFVADFPDDQVEAGGDIKVFGGRNLAVTLGKIFVSLGCSNVSEPWSAGEMGWEFDFDYKGRHSFWCRVQSFHPIFWLLLEGPSSKSDRRSYPGFHFELWQKFANALELDPRFDQIFWRTRDQGPPDWDEFTVEHLSPVPEIAGESWPSEVQRPRGRSQTLPPSRAQILVGSVLTILGLAAFVIGQITRHQGEQVGVSGIGAVTIIVGLTWLLARKEQRRDRDPPGQAPIGSPQDEDAP
jgi:hypothetical protein